VSRLHTILGWWRLWRRAVHAVGNGRLLEFGYCRWCCDRGKPKLAQQALWVVETDAERSSGIGSWTRRETDQGALYLACAWSGLWVRRLAIFDSSQLLKHPLKVLPLSRCSRSVRRHADPSCIATGATPGSGFPFWWGRGGKSPTQNIGMPWYTWGQVRRRLVPTPGQVERLRVLPRTAPSGRLTPAARKRWSLLEFLRSIALACVDKDYLQQLLPSSLSAQSPNRCNDAF